MRMLNLGKNSPISALRKEDMPTVKNSLTRAKALDRGRESWRQRAWGQAFYELSAADRETPLDPADLELLAQSGYLIGRDAEGAEFLARAHRGFLDRGETRRAVRSAFWLGFTALVGGEIAQAGGWLSRAGRLLEGQPECVEHGYLILPVAFRAVHEGDPDGAYRGFVEVQAYGRRFEDRDLVTLGLQGQGRALIRKTEIARGVALLDEAMVAVTAGEVSPLVAGGVYCSVIEACGEIFDLRRAQEWTAALEQWCSAQPDLVPYRGHCLIRRAEILQHNGSWKDALEETRHACELLSQPKPKPAIGAAYYRKAEVHRLRGEFEAAEDSYRSASQWGGIQQPGWALLRLAQGKLDEAKAAICRLKDEVIDPGRRALILEACVEIANALHDTQAAKMAAQELSEIAARFGAPFLDAISRRASGIALLAQGNAKDALPVLRDSWQIWQELDAPYEAARVRVLIALACRHLGDVDAANMELAAAQQVFEQLGAAPDLERTKAVVQRTPGSRNGLTPREVEILKLIAAGMTNRKIASKLFISEKTVARHVSNIFVKLDLSSRTAATAYAYQHELV